MKRYKNIVSIVTLAIALIFGAVAPQTVGAQDLNTQNVNVSLHKRIFDYEEKESLKPNTGEIMEDFGGEPLANVEFTAYDITSYFTEKVKTSDNDKAMAEIQEEMMLGNLNTDDYKPVVGTNVVTTDAEGIATFKNLPVYHNAAEETFKVYAFLETKTPSNVTVVERATPIILALPIGETTPETLHLYPKNYRSTDTKNLVNIDDFTVMTDDKNTVVNVSSADVLNFQLNLNIPADIANRTYSVTDTASEGLVLHHDSFKVYNGSELLEEGFDYTVNKGTNGFKLELISESEAIQSLAGRVLTVQYSMKVENMANVDGRFENNVTVTIDEDPQPNIPTTPEDPEKPIVITTGGHKFIKVDAKTELPLENAKFVVKNEAGEFATFIKRDAYYELTGWVTEVSEATVILSPKDGKFSVAGLSDGVYALEETEAPSPEYAKLKKPVSFEVKSGNYNDQSDLVIKNAVKGLLPSTGGVGIYGFIVAGAALMLGSLVWYKKSNKEA